MILGPGELVVARLHYRNRILVQGHTNRAGSHTYGCKKLAR